MKYKLLLVIIGIIFFFSCEKKEYLEVNFKNEIIKYQVKFPLQKKSDTVFPFYALSFRRIKNDTIFYISRYYVRSKEHFDNLEIFEDEKLKPTEINDFDSLTLNIVKEFPESKRNDLLKAPRAVHVNPTHLYKMNGLKIILLKEENY